MNLKKIPSKKNIFFWSKNIFNLEKKIWTFSIFRNLENDFQDFEKSKMFRFFFSTLKIFFDQKKMFFFDGIFLIFIYSFRRIDWERFQSASDNTNPPIIEKRVSIFWIIFLKISWKSLGLNGGWAKVTKNTMKKFRFQKKSSMPLTSDHFLPRTQSLSQTLHGALRTRGTKVHALRGGPPIPLKN